MEQRMTGTFYGVSVGPGDPELLTLQAVRLLRQCPVLAAPQTASGQMLALDIARRALGSELDGKIILPLQFAMSRDAAVLRASHETAASAVRPFLDAGQDVAMLNLGDVSIYGVSVGPGDPELLTLQAVRLLRQCPVLAAPQTASGQMLALDIARRALGSELDGKIILPLQFAMSRDAAVLRASHETAASAVRPFLDAGQDVAMLNLGDVSIYATFGYLQEILQAQGYATAMAAGVPSFCAAAARLNQPLTGGMDAPLTIAPGSRSDEVLDAPGTKVLMKTGRQLPALLDTLDAHGALSRSALVCSCGLPDETIFPDLSTARPPQDGSKAGYFATVLVKE